MTAAEVLLIEAERLIGERGWRQGNGDPKLNLCADQAVFYSCEPQDREGAIRALVSWLGIQKGGLRPFLSPIAWNDAPDRTEAEVRAALLAAAKATA